MTRLYKISPTKPSAFVHFDWLTIVFPIGLTDSERHGLSVEQYIDAVLCDMSLDNLVYEYLRKGLYTYTNAKATANNSIIIGWYQPDHFGKLIEGHNTFCIQLSGAGVESLESFLANDGMTVADMIKTVTNTYGATFSRVDACCNFFNYPKEYSARYVGEEAEKGHLVARSSSVRMVRSFSSKGGKDSEEAYQGALEGFTTYIGKNPKQLRVYNKLAERSEKVNLRYQVKSWSRWEFQLNRKQAQAFIDGYLERNCDLTQTWIDWLAFNYRWIEEVGHQSRRDRYPNASWYDDLIKTAKDKIFVRSEKQKPTFERAKKWIDTQVMPTLASIYFARLYKYQENGIAYSDAQKLALEKVKKDIEEVALDQNVKWDQVTAFLKEMKDER